MKKLRRVRPAAAMLAAYLVVSAVVFVVSLIAEFAEHDAALAFAETAFLGLVYVGTVALSFCLGAWAYSAYPAVRQWFATNFPDMSKGWFGVDHEPRQEQPRDKEGSAE